MLLVAAVALPMEQGGNPALKPAKATKNEQLMSDGRELRGNAAKVAVNLSAVNSSAVNSSATATAADLTQPKNCNGRSHSDRCNTAGEHPPGAGAIESFFARQLNNTLGSVSLVVNQTGQFCSHLVPLDTNFRTTPSLNRHKYNEGKFGANALQSGFAEFLGPHQTAEWFGVSPATWTNKKIKNGHDAVQVRVASITLDKALYIDSFDMVGLPMPNGAYYPQMSDPRGYPRPLYLASHDGTLNLTITEACGTQTVHQVTLDGTAWENGQPGSWKRLKVGKQVKAIKFSGGRDSTWAVKNFCGAAPWQERMLQAARESATSETLLRSAKSDIVLMAHAPQAAADGPADSTDPMVLRAAAAAAAARRRAGVVCASVPPFDVQACVDPCSTSWDDWCEQTNNDGKACGEGSPDDTPCLSKTCKCHEVGKVNPQQPLFPKKDCASKTYVVRTNVPVDPTMTWLSDSWCQSYCSTPDGCPDDVNDLCACDSQQQQDSEEEQSAVPTFDAEDAASTAEAEQKMVDATASAAKDAEMMGRAAEQKVHNAEGTVGQAPVVDTGAAEQKVKEEEFEQKVKEEQQRAKIEEGAAQSNADDEVLFCPSGYTSKDETASDLWCSNACGNGGCAKDAQGVCECADGSHGCDQRLTPGCGIKTPKPILAEDDLLEPIDGSFEETISCLSISAEKTDDWCNYACRVTGSTRTTNHGGCPPYAQKDCKCGDEANTEVRLLARVAAAARARAKEDQAEN